MLLPDVASCFLNMVRQLPVVLMRLHMGEACGGSGGKIANADPPYQPHPIPEQPPCHPLVPRFAPPF